MTTHDSHILSQFFLRLANAHEAADRVESLDHMFDKNAKRVLVADQTTMVRVLVNYVLANGERIKDEVNRL